MIKTLRLAVIAFNLLSIEPTALAAQITIVTGTVYDPNGHPAAGVRILVSDQVALRAVAITDQKGTFQVADLPHGRYELRVAANGFSALPTILEFTGQAVQPISFVLVPSAVTESIVVTAAGRPIPRSRVTDSVTVVTADEIATKQFETVADALRFAVPGLGITTTGGRGGLTSLYTRGGESDFTLVLLDGIRVNDFGGAYDFAHLPIGEVERIEVVRGPQSALYGSDAIGGVVQIITKRGGPAQTAATIEGGNYGTSRVSVNSSGSAKELDWGVALEQLDTNGLNGHPTQSGTIVSNDNYLRRNLSLNGQWKGNRGTTVNSVFRYGTNGRGFPGPWGLDPGGTYPGLDTISTATNDNQLISGGLTQRLGTRTDQRVDVSYTGSKSLFKSPYGESVSDVNRLTVRTATNVTLGSNVVASGGLDLQQEQAGSTFITDTSFSAIPVDRRLVGVFGEMRFDPHPDVSVTAGLRGDHIKRALLLGDGFVRPPLPVSIETAANPKFSLGWYLRPPTGTSNWTRVRLGAGTGLRPPSAFEIAFTDNPALKSERTRSVDLGVEQAIADGKVQIEATGFFNTYDDLIVAVGQSFQNASQFKTDNLSNSRAHGLELTFTGRTTSAFLMRATYTWLHTKILAVDTTTTEAPGSFSVGDALLRRPRHQGAVELSFTQPLFSVFSSIGTRSQTLDVDPTLGAFGGLYNNPGYALVNTGASIHAHSKLEILARIQNLFNRTYEEVLGFPSLGRSLIAGIRVLID